MIRLHGHISCIRKRIILFLINFSGQTVRISRSACMRKQIIQMLTKLYKSNVTASIPSPKAT